MHDSNLADVAVGEIDRATSVSSETAGKQSASIPVSVDPVVVVIVVTCLER